MKQKIETDTLRLVPAKYDPFIKEAMETFTNEINALKLAEESSELAAAILQHYNDASKSSSILEEIVGTLICMEQFIAKNYSQTQIDYVFDVQIS